MPFKQKINETTKQVEKEVFPDNFLADTKEDAEKLLLEFNPTIKFLAFKYAKMTGLCEEDLEQEAIIGLARANRDFDIERSEQFKIFAIYKIKDAIHEYAASQASDVSIPQYLISATSLISKIYRFLIMFSVDTNGSYVDIWGKANEFVNNEDIDIVNEENKETIRHTKDELSKVINSLENLAKRSMTTVVQLLERAQSLPTISKSEDQHIEAYEDYMVIDNSENTLLNSIATFATIEKIKEILSEGEYALIISHYVEGKTLRELETELGIKAPSIAVRIDKIMNKIRKRIKHECTESA